MRLCPEIHYNKPMTNSLFLSLALPLTLYVAQRVTMSGSTHSFPHLLGTLNSQGVQTSSGLAAILLLLVYNRFWHKVL